MSEPEIQVLIWRGGQDASINHDIQGPPCSCRRISCPCSANLGWFVTAYSLHWLAYIFFFRPRNHIWMFLDVAWTRLACFGARPQLNIGCSANWAECEDVHTDVHFSRLRFIETTPRHLRTASCSSNPAVVLILIGLMVLWPRCQGVWKTSKNIQCFTGLKMFEDVWCSLKVIFTFVWQHSQLNELELRCKCLDLRWSGHPGAFSKISP